MHDKVGLDLGLKVELKCIFMTLVPAKAAATHPMNEEGGYPL